MDNKMASFGGRREFQRKSHWKFFLFLIFLTAFLVSGGLLLRNLYRSQQEQAAYDALAEQVHQMEKQIAEAGGRRSAYRGRRSSTVSGAVGEKSGFGRMAFQ